jgi:hypothetical protein
MAASDRAADAIGIASDHAGYELKTALISTLRDRGMDVVDLGTNGPDSVDYPDFADALAETMAAGKASRGILVCGTGIGIAMAANRHGNTMTPMSLPSAPVRPVRKSRRIAFRFSSIPHSKATPIRVMRGVSQKYPEAR